MSLRPELYFDAVADVKPTNQTHQGSAVTFEIFSDLAAQTATLNESTDVDAIALSDSQVTITLEEKGAATVLTAKVRGTSFIPLDPVRANLVGYNAGMSMDTLAQTVLAGGTNVDYATGGATNPTARNTVEPDDTLTGYDVRKQRARLMAASVQSFGGYYTAFIHPDVAFDLRGETGGTGWRDPHVYSQPDLIWNGEVGAFEGFRFIETPRAPVFADAGSSTTLTDVYATLFLGRQAMAKAWSSSVSGPQPSIVMGEQVDKLKRFWTLGWYQFVARGRFREASLRRVESASSLGTNA